MAIISTKFPSKCASCGSFLGTGARVWYGGKTHKGVLCLGCHEKGEKLPEKKPQPETPKESPQDLPKREQPKVTKNVTDGKLLRQVFIHKALDEWFSRADFEKHLRKISDENSTNYYHTCVEDRTSFRGASPSNIDKMLQGVKSIDSYSDQRANNLANLFPESVGSNYKRRRRRTEDGEIIEESEHIYSDKPFTSMIRQARPIKTVTLDCYICASGCEDSSDVTKAGSIMLGIIESLESRGILCGVNVILETKRFDENRKSSARCEIKVKSPGEYIHSNILRACFTGWFMRSVGFDQIMRTGIESGLYVDSGLGCPNSPEFSINGSTVSLSFGNITSKTTEIVDGIVKNFCA